MTRWYTIAQAAPMLGVSKAHIRYLIQHGTIPAVKAGSQRNGTWLITGQAINDYNHTRRERATAAQQPVKLPPTGTPGSTPGPAT